jgi:phage tail sheath gpL-like
MANVLFVGFDNDATPGYYAQRTFGKGGRGAGDLAFLVLLCGTMIAGTSTPNSSVDALTNGVQEAATRYGAHSEMVQLVKATLANNPNASIVCAPSAEADSATSAIATLTVSGTWSTTGQLNFAIDGEEYSAVIDALATLTQAAASIAKPVSDSPYAPATAGSSVAVATFTIASKGGRGNDHRLYVDTSQLPPGCIVTLGGGGAALDPGGIKFAGGAGTEDVTPLLANVFPRRYKQIAAAQADAANAARWINHVNAAAGMVEGRAQQIQFGGGGSLTAATSLAQTTLNAVRSCLPWLNNSESPPAWIAAAIAGLRSAYEATDPVAYYDNVELKGIAPQRNVADIPSHATIKTALNTGVSPLFTENGKVYVAMLITTHSLDGTMSDYNTRATYCVTMPDWAADDAGLQWVTRIKPANPRSGPNQAPGGRPRPPNVWTPDRSTVFLTGLTRGYEDNGWTLEPGPGDDVAQSWWNDAANRVEAYFPIRVTPGNHQYLVNVQQVAA